MNTYPNVEIRITSPTSLLLAPIASAIIKLTIAVGHEKSTNISKVNPPKPNKIIYLIQIFLDRTQQVLYV